MADNTLSPVFGRLSWESIPLHEPILLGTFLVVVVLGIGIIGAVTYFKLWGWLWREWLTSVDHKKIGVMYMILGIIMLLRGFADALMMRLQQAWSFGALVAEGTPSERLAAPNSGASSRWAAGPAGGRSVGRRRR